MVERRHPSIKPTHPGELLAEDIIPASGLTKTDIAERLGVSRQTLYDLLSCRQPVTPNLAARLGRLFGNGAGFWLRLQAAHDTWMAEHEIDVSAVRPLNAA